MRQLFNTEPAALAEAIDGATDELLGLIQAAPALALSRVVRQPSSGGGHYGVRHSIHAATACQAAARFLGWSDSDQRRAFQAALTMNIAMVDLQARLATQVSPLTARQREAIHEHPHRGAQMLADAGIRDEAWLQAVRLHHELPDGSGYPAGTSERSELAEMLRFADVYTARLSDRADRPAISARQAGRELHQMAAASPWPARSSRPSASFRRAVSCAWSAARWGSSCATAKRPITRMSPSSPRRRGAPPVAQARRHLARQPCGIGPAAGPCHADADQRGNDRRTDRRGLSRPRKKKPAEGRAFRCGRGATQGVGVATT